MPEWARIHAADHYPRVLFWSFCLIVFSKIAWYDLRIYSLPGVRRDVLTQLFAVWVVGQLLLYAAMARTLLRQPRRLVLFWCLLVSPYILLGVILGKVNLFLLGDIARYGMPIGFLLFSLWAVENLGPRTLVWAIGGSMAVFICVRALLHFALRDGQLIRYGVQWEVFLICLLVAAGFILDGRSFALLLLAISIAVTLVALGQSRAVLLGVCIGAVIVGFLAFRQPVRSGRVRVCAAAGVAVVAVIGSSGALGGRVGPTSFVDAIWNSNSALLSEPVPERSARTTERPDSDSDSQPSKPGPTRSPARDSPTESSRSKDPEVTGGPSRALDTEGVELAAEDIARERLERAIAANSLTLEVRIAESLLFLTRMTRDTRTLLLGAGSGGYLTIHLPNHERIVRGAHNTYVTLLYRHGVALGAVLILFVSVFGLPTNLRQLQRAHSAHWRVLLTALVSYRIAVVVMAQVHQGLFDDPLVFMSIAIAATSSPSRGGGRQLEAPRQEPANCAGNEDSQ